MLAQFSNFEKSAKFSCLPQANDCFAEEILKYWGFILFRCLIAKLLQSFSVCTIVPNALFSNSILSYIELLADSFFFLEENHPKLQFYLTKKNR